MDNIGIDHPSKWFLITIDSCNYVKIYVEFCYKQLTTNKVKTDLLVKLFNTLQLYHFFKKMYGLNLLP